MINRQNVIDAAEAGSNGRERLMWMIAFGVGFALSLFFNLGSAPRSQTPQRADKVNGSGLVMMPASTTVADGRVTAVERRRFD